MNPEALFKQLQSLATDIKEQVSYYQELGVEFVGTVPTSETPSAVNPPVESSVRPTGQTSEMSSVAKKFVAKRPAGPSPVSEAPNALFADLKPTPEIIAKSTESFEQIHADLMNCLRCPLHQCRTNIVHTEGNPRARLMFVGEAPGADEDAQARPFVGRAGQLLTKIIESIGFQREDVLIGNINRCRPPENRAPTSEEAAMCKPFLLREIAAVQPEVIVVLGNTAMRNLLETREGITKLRGNFQNYKGIKVMPTFHPAYLLRDPSKKRETWEDLKKVRDYLESTANDQKPK